MSERELFLWVAFAVLAGFVWWFSSTFAKGGKEIANLLNDLDARIKDLDRRLSRLEK